MLRLIKLRLRALLPPALFLGLTFYFGWNAVHGRSGLEAQVGQRAALAAAQANFAAIDAQRQVWETRVAGLANASIDPDVLDGGAGRLRGRTRRAGAKNEALNFCGGLVDCKPSGCFCDIILLTVYSRRAC